MRKETHLGPSESLIIGVSGRTDVQTEEIFNWEAAQMSVFTARGSSNISLVSCDDSELC